MSDETRFLLWGMALVIVAGVAFVFVSCQRPVGSAVTDPRAGRGEVVMTVGGADVERYENDRVICFAWGGGHGSVTCQDKSR